MDLQAQLESFNRAVEDFTDRAKAYFAQLDAKERYGWMAEGGGFAIFLAGIVLLIL